MEKLKLFYFRHYQLRYDLPKWCREMQRFHLRIFLYSKSLHSLPTKYHRTSNSNPRLFFWFQNREGFTWDRQCFTPGELEALSTEEFPGLSQLSSITLSAPRLALRVFLWALLTPCFVSFSLLEAVDFSASEFSLSPYTHHLTKRGNLIRGYVAIVEGRWVDRGSLMTGTGRH